MSERPFQRQYNLEESCMRQETWKEVKTFSHFNIDLGELNYYLFVKPIAEPNIL